MGFRFMAAYQATEFPRRLEAFADFGKLLESSVWRRKALMGAEHSKMEDYVQDDLHEATMKEVELGHLHGPLSEEEVTAHFGSDKWLFNPRMPFTRELKAR